ncbi:hypothetical protein SAMN05192557_2108 [Aliicoccus persicus]|uniref:Uncharacterized protein n=1 Tax=Aliicoccus persicus TaxID=930138 RepID=A0A662Z5J7_9STAP|nr:hypothetical protein SAMN05192557_2108 [Aliicoccus persicus]
MFNFELKDKIILILFLKFGILYLVDKNNNVPQ